MPSPAAAFVDAPLPGGMPEGWRAAPVWTGDQGAPLRLCVIARQTADPAAGALVSLGGRPDAAIYLGCVADAGGQPREWLEWWVQDTDQLAGAPGMNCPQEAYHNALLDEQWAGRAEALRRLAPDMILQTGWESAHPPPLWLDPAKWQPVTLTDPESGAAWTLCQDDAALQAAGLPPYGASLHRYLWTTPKEGNSDAATRFAAMTPDAPAPAAGMPPLVNAAEAFGALVPFNPAGGLMMVRAFLPLDYEQFADLLGGAPWTGLPHGKDAFPLGGVYNELARLEEPGYRGGHLFSAGQSRAGRMAERFYLKLNLLLGAMRAVRRMTAERRLPLLNLSAASFRVQLSEPAADLPFLWGARPVLHVPGEAAPLAAATALGARYFLPGPGTTGTASPYRPDVCNRFASGSRTVRLRKFHRLEDGKFALEGAFLSAENAFSPSDLIRLRLRLGAGGQRVDLYAQLDPAQGAATPGEMAFRTLAQPLAEPLAQALATAAGSIFPAVPFEALPLLSSPCDLYALGVLAVRTLLVNGGNTLPAALESFFQLVRLAAPPTDQTSTALPLAIRLEKTAQADAGRWLEALGPQRLMRDILPPAQAFDHLPPTLWWQALAATARLFPGLDLESVCRDYADVPPEALETAFDLPLRQLETLTLRARSLIVGDWQQNREIREVIEQCKRL